MRRFGFSILLLVAACSSPAPLSFDGGDCGQRLPDGGVSPADPTALTCEVEGDRCRRFIYDDPCPTTCTCGEDAGWQCERTCPPLEPCRMGGYCTLMETSCEVDDAGCTRVCQCAYGHVFTCAPQCP